MQIKSVTEYEKFCALKERWDRLFLQSGGSNIFLSWQWFDLCWRHSSVRLRPLILVAEDGDRLLGIAPLMNVKGGLLTFGKSVITFLDVDNNADYRDFLISNDDEEVVEHVIAFLLDQKGWGRIDLRRIYQNSPSVDLIQKTCKQANKSFVSRVNCVSPCVRVNDSWEDYYSGLSKGLRQDIRTGINKFSKLGNLHFEVSDTESLPGYLDALFRMHGQRQSGKAGLSIFGNQQSRDFFRDAAQIFSNSGCCEVSVLRIDEKIISAVFALIYGGTYYYWIPSFDPSYEKYSPGKVHLYYLIQRCFEDGVSLFDFMIGDEAYKLRWANDSVDIVEFQIFDNKVTYILNSGAWGIKAFLKKCKRKYCLLESIWKSFSKNKLLMKLSHT